MTYSFTFEYDRAEFRRAHHAILRHAIRRRRWLSWMGMLFFGVFLVINMSADIERGSFPAALPGLLAMVVWPFIPLLSGYFVVRQWERLNPIGHRMLTVTIDDNRFASGSYVGTSELNWVAVKQVVETSEFLLVYVTERFGYYLPLRVMSASDREQIRALVRSKVDSRYRAVFRRPDSRGGSSDPPQ